MEEKARFEWPTTKDKKDMLYELAQENKRSAAKQLDYLVEEAYKEFKEQNGIHLQRLSK